MSEISRQTGITLFKFGKSRRNSLLLLFLIFIILIVQISLIWPIIEQYGNIPPFLSVFILEYVQNIDLFIISGIVLFGSIIVFIFIGINMVIRLNRAATLSQSFNLRRFLQVLVISIISGIISFFVDNFEFSSVLLICALIGTSVAFRFYAQFLKEIQDIQTNPRAHTKIKAGFILYTVQASLYSLFRIIQLSNLRISFPMILISFVLSVLFGAIAQMIVAFGTMALFSHYCTSRIPIKPESSVNASESTFNSETISDE